MNNSMANIVSTRTQAIDNAINVAENIINEANTGKR